MTRLPRLFCRSVDIQPTVLGSQSPTRGCVHCSWEWNIYLVFCPFRSIILLARSSKFSIIYVLYILYFPKVKHILSFNTSCSVCWTERQASRVFLETNGCNLSKSSNLRKIIIIIISNGCNPFKQLKCEDNQMVIIGNCPYCHVISYKQAFTALTSEVVIGSFPNFHDMIWCDTWKEKVSDQWGRRGQIVFQRCLSPCNVQSVQSWEISGNLEKYN